ncbi:MULTISPECIES: hypothetical protein [unclassified Janthinobacterium]|uniref:hypothetical protein n=1 Tax=unclassified Janthinobacterium TaxID=2610881 RepID=UPI0012EB4189|nr:MULTISPECIES: hypothetical protein [unclassified Janthinobacterium]MDO8040340.1 hypothetical protein [Janthinobacterium sp. SUN137]
MNLFEEALKGSINAVRILKSNQKKSDSDIFVFPNDVAAVIKMYLQQKISASDLKEWASLILSVESYICPNWENYELADRYQPMWDILQRLEMPAIHGQISASIAETYLQKLDSI